MVAGKRYQWGLGNGICEREVLTLDKLDRAVCKKKVWHVCCKIKIIAILQWLLASLDRAYLVLDSW